MSPITAVIISLVLLINAKTMELTRLDVLTHPITQLVTPPIPLVVHQDHLSEISKLILPAVCHLWL